MSENRIQEQNRADARAQENRRRAYRPSIKSLSQNAGLQGQATAQAKPNKSNFDNVLDNLKQPQQQSVPVSPEVSQFDAQLSEVTQEEERPNTQTEERRDDEQKVGENEDRRTGENASRSKSHPKILAKRGLNSQNQGNQSGSQQQGSGGQEQKPKSSLEAEAKQPTRSKQEPEIVASAGSLQADPTSTTSEMLAVSPPRELPKAVLDQIIQAVTVSKDKDLKKEMEIRFHDNFFNGTKLKVVAKNGKIQVEFIVPNREVEQTFKYERDGLAEALGHQGIELDSIEVVLS